MATERPYFGLDRDAYEQMEMAQAEQSHELEQLREQRDALVAACTELIDALEASTYDHEWVDIKEQARAVLALDTPQEAVR